MTVRTYHLFSHIISEKWPQIAQYSPLWNSLCPDVVSNEFLGVSIKVWNFVQDDTIRILTVIGDIRSQECCK